MELGNDIQKRVGGNDARLDSVPVKDFRGKAEKVLVAGYQKIEKK